MNDQRLIALSRLSSLLIAGVLFVGCGNSSQAESPQTPSKAPQVPDDCPEDKANGPESTVHALYKNYAWDVRKTTPIHNEPRNVLLMYFDENLAGLLLKNQECEKREQGICNIDTDILYAAQDVEVTDFQICAMYKDNNIVSVRFKNIGTPQVVKYKLSHTPAGWRVSDILYTWNTGSATLVEILSQKMP